METRIIIAGCRTFTCYAEAKEAICRDLEALKSGKSVIVLSGGCRGADRLGERFAEEAGWTIERHLPEWEKYGRAAGPIRNKQMIEHCDAVICFWDGKSKGTASLIRYAQKHEKPLFLHIVDA